MVLPANGGLFDLLDRLEREAGDGRRAPALTN
jgi:hypothetical protein